MCDKHFTNKNIVEQIITKQPHIVVNNIKITYQRLINPAKKITISNVQPIIPHDIITKAITNISIRILSPITFMKAGFSNEEYDHIGSFRRQLYIHPDENEKMPGSILINFDQTDYRLFFSDATVICYLCKQSGHTPNYFKNVIENKTTSSHINNPPPATGYYDTENNTQVVPHLQNIPKASINSKIITKTILYSITNMITQIQEYDHHRKDNPRLNRLIIAMIAHRLQ